MRAIQQREFGGPEVLELVEVPVPEPARGQVLIRVTAAGINFADTHQREDSYVQKQSLPLTPGSEVAGVREDTGERVVALDRERRRLTTDLGCEQPYDELVFATGSFAATPGKFITSPRPMMPGQPSASATSAAEAYRPSGRLAIIRRRTAATAGGTSARSCSTGTGSAFRCATSFSSHAPSGKGGRPASRK